MTRPIFDYPSDWEIFDLSPSKKNDVILDVSQGRTPPTQNSDYWEGSIPWLTPKEVTDRYTHHYAFRSERFLTEKGAKKAGGIKQVNTVMLTKRAPVGYVVINKVPMAAGMGFLNFVCGTKLIPEFLLHWFQGNKPYLERIANGTTFDELYPFDLFELKIGIPEISEQQKIVNVLNSIDDKIQESLKVKKLLVSSLYSVYKNWFVCNDNTNELKKNYKTKQEVWKKVTFNTLATTQRGFSYKGLEKFQNPRGHVFVTLKNINMSGGFNTVYSWIDSSRLKERHFMNELDLVIANTHFGVGGSNFARLLANPGLIVFPYNYSKSKGVFSHHISKLLLKKDNIKFFLYFLFLDEHLKIANKYHTGTGVLSLDYKNFEKQYEVILPPDALLEQFEKIAFNIFNRILSQEKQIMMLEDVKDLNKRRLVYGKTRLE